MSGDPNSGDLFNKIKARFHSDVELDAPQKLKNLLDALYRKKEISDRQYALINGTLDFQTKMAREVMVPRTDALMIDINDDLQSNLDIILREPYSRIPVYNGDKDKVIGIVHIRNILRTARKVGFEKIEYEDIMFDPLFAPEIMALDDLLFEMQKTQKQLAILTDEYGGVVGLVTIEDIIEEIVGDIDDEVDEAEILTVKLNDSQYIINGKMPLTDFNEEFGTDLEMENVDTVAGYVITKLGLIPSKGEVLSVKLDNGMILKTRRMKGSRLRTVSLTIPKTMEKEE